MTEEKALSTDVDETKTLDWYLAKRNGKKRDYIFSVSKMKTCPHNHLHAMVTGGIKYRCEDCNWCFDIVTTYAQPLHNVVVGSMLQALHFAKEFGIDNLQEVLRTPKGQHELDYHLPALPEGMSFWDALEALETIDVNAPDRGAGELRQLFEEKWVPVAERQRRHQELASANPYLKKILEERGGLMAALDPGYANAIGDRDAEERALSKGESDDTANPIGNGTGEARPPALGGAEMPSLPSGDKQGSKDRPKRRTRVSRLRL